MNVINRVFQVCERKSELVQKVYQNVCLGLMTFAVTAFGVVRFFDPGIVSTMAMLSLFPAIGIPLFVQSKIYSICNRTASILFYAYCASLGLCCSTILYSTSTQQIIIACVMTGFLFSFALYAARYLEIDSTDTKLLYTGILVVLCMSIINIFLRLGVLELLISVAGMAMAVGLVAYEISEFETMSMRHGYDLDKISIKISLRLVSNIVTLLMYVIRFLRITGTGRNRD